MYTEKKDTLERERGQITDSRIESDRDRGGGGWAPMSAAAVSAKRGPDKGRGAMASI